MWHLPSPPALPASFGGFLVLPEFVPSPGPSGQLGSSAGALRPGRGESRCCPHCSEGIRDTCGHSVSPPFAPPAPCGCQMPPVPVLPEHVPSWGAIIPDQTRRNCSCPGHENTVCIHGEQLYLHKHPVLWWHQHPGAVMCHTLASGVPQPHIPWGLGALPAPEHLSLGSSTPATPLCLQSHGRDRAGPTTLLPCH